MIDIHSHALYDCDDGSKNIEQTIKMLKTAKESGIESIFFTPHYMEDGYKNDKNSIYKKIESLKGIVKEQNLDIELYCGEEIFIYPNLDEDFEKIISLNNTKYILIELPMIESINYLDDVIYRILANDKIPIIAHPERYLITEKNISFVEDLINKGALMQINVNSLTGCYGKTAEKIAKKLLKKNLVHFVASDAHSTHGYKKVSESLNILRKVVSAEKFNEITFENQQKLIQNKEIKLKEMEYKRKIFSLRFLKKEA